MKFFSTCLILASIVLAVVAGSPVSRDSAKGKWIYNDTDQTLYMYMSETVSFSVAKAQCEALGATLVSSLARTSGNGENWVGLQRDAQDASKIFYVSGRTVLSAEYPDNVENITYDAQLACYYSVDADKPIRHTSCTDKKSTYCERPIVDRPTTEWQRLNDVMEIIIVPLRAKQEDVAQHCNDLFNAQPLFINNEVTAKDLIFPAMMGDPLVDVNEGIFTGVLQNDTSITYIGEAGFHALLGTTDRFTTGTTPSSSLAPKLVGNNGNPSFSSVSASTELPFGCSRIIKQVSSFSKPSGNTVDVGKSTDVEVTLSRGVTHGDGRYFVYSDPPTNAWVSPNIVRFSKCVNAGNCSGPMLTQTVKIHGVTAGNIKLHLRAMSTLEIARSVSPIDITVKPLPSITFSPTSISVRIRETKQVTVTLSQRFDSSVINASFLPPTDPCVNFGPMVFSEGSTTTSVRVTGITKCNVAKEYLVIPEAPTGNLYAPIPKLSVEVVDPIQLVVTGAQFLYDGSTSTQEGISMEPSAELPKAITVTLSHNCSNDLFKLSVTSFNFIKNEKRTTMVTAEPIEGKWMHCAISFTASNLYATAQPNAHVIQVRRQSELKFTQFPTLMMPGAVEPVHVSIDQYWPTEGEVRFAVSLSGMEPTVTCQEFVFSNAQTSLTSSCQAGSGEADVGKTAQVTYTVSGTSTNLRSFRPAANHIRPTMKMTNRENGKFLMQFHSADLRYDNCYAGVNKKFLVWSKAELFNVDTDWEWQPHGAGCQSMPLLKKYNPIGHNGNGLAGSFETYCNTGERTIQLPAALNSGLRFVNYENRLEMIPWKDGNDRPVPTVSVPSTRSIKAGGEATLFVSLPKPVSSGTTVTVTMATSASSVISVVTGEHVFNPGDEQISGIPMPIKAENVASSVTAVITISVAATDPNFLPSSQLYQQTWTARVVKPLQVADADPSAKNCFIGAFEVNINFGSFTPTNDFTFELYIVSGFSTDSITISPTTRTLNSGATAATFTVSAPYFSPGKLKFSAKCLGICSLDVGFGSVEITIDALRYLTMSLPNSGMIRTGQSGTASVKHVGTSAPFSSEIENVVTSGHLSVTDSKTFLRESQTDTLIVTAGETTGRQTITATPLSAKVFMNHNFVLPVEVYGPATGSVSMAIPQLMVVGSEYSVDLMLGQLAGAVTASHDSSSSSSDLDKNLQLDVSPSSYMFSASTRSTTFMVTPSHPLRRQLKFSMSGNTQFTSHSVGPDDFWAVSKLSIGLGNVPQELVSGELNKRTFTITAGNTPPRVSGTSFTISLQGDNTGNLTLNVSTFSRGWGNNTESIPVEMLGLGDANITIVVTPDPTTWYDVVSSHTIAVLRLLKVYTELDFNVLYGTKDIAELAASTEKLLDGNKTLLLTPSYNVSVLESTPTVYTFTSNDSNNGMVFNLSVADWYVAPTHGEAVLVEFSLSGTDGLLYTQHRTVELFLLPHLNFSISNNGNDVVYDGPENAVDFTISIPKLPKKSRRLNLTVSCVLLSPEADASCSLSRSWVTFGDSGELSQNVSVTTVGVANVSVVTDADPDTTNATEFHPYATAFTNVSAVDKLKTSVNVLNGTKFLPIGATATLNVSSEPQLLAASEALELSWSFDDSTSGVSSSPPSLSWDSSAPSSSSLVFSPTIAESACPQDARVKLSVKAPSKYYTITHPQHANFTIVAPKDINVTTYSQNLFLNAEQRSGHINITVPRPNNTVSREVVNLTISCNSSILSFVDDTFSFSETELFHQVWVASSNTTTGSALCYLHFHGDLDFEYRDTAIPVTFVVHDQIDVRVDVKHSAYVNVDETMQLTVTNAIHLCEPGTSIHVVATFSTNSNIGTLMFAWVSGSGGQQLQAAKKFKSSTVMTVWVAFTVSGSCFAVNTTMEPRSITFFPSATVTDTHSATHSATRSQSAVHSGTRTHGATRTHSETHSSTYSGDSSGTRSVSKSPRPSTSPSLEPTPPSSFTPSATLPLAPPTPNPPTICPTSGDQDEEGLRILRVEDTSVNTGGHHASREELLASSSMKNEVDGYEFSNGHVFTLYIAYMPKDDQNRRLFRHSEFLPRLNTSADLDDQLALQLVNDDSTPMTHALALTTSENGVVPDSSAPALLSKLRFPFQNDTSILAVDIRRWSASLNTNDDHTLYIAFSRGCFDGCITEKESYATLRLTKVVRPLPPEARAAGQAAAITTGAVSSVTGNPTTAMYQARASLAMQLSVCKFRHDEPLELMQNPLDLTIGDPIGGYYRGGVLANWVIVLTMVTLLLLLSLMHALYDAYCDNDKYIFPPSPFERFKIGTVNAHFPSFAVVPFAMFMQGQVMCSLALILYGGTPSLDITIGVLSLLLVLAVVIGGFVLTATRHFTPVFMTAADLDAMEKETEDDHEDEEDDELTDETPDERAERKAREREENMSQMIVLQEMVASSITKFFHGDAKWKNSPKHPTFKQRFGQLFVDYRKGCQAFLCVEFSISLVTGILEGARPEQGWACFSIVIIALALNIFLLGALLVKSPLIAKFNQLHALCTVAGTCVSILSLVVAQYYSSEIFLQTGESLSLIVIFLCAIKALFDIFVILQKIKMKIAARELTKHLRGGFKSFSGFSQRVFEKFTKFLSPTEKAKKAEEKLPQSTRRLLEQQRQVVQQRIKTDPVGAPREQRLNGCLVPPQSETTTVPPPALSKPLLDETSSSVSISIVESPENVNEEEPNHAAAIRSRQMERERLEELQREAEEDDRLSVSGSSVADLSVDENSLQANKKKKKKTVMFGATEYSMPLLGSVGDDEVVGSTFGLLPLTNSNPIEKTSSQHNKKDSTAEKTTTKKQKKQPKRDRSASVAFNNIHQGLNVEDFFLGESDGLETTGTLKTSSTSDVHDEDEEEEEEKKKNTDVESSKIPPATSEQQQQLLLDILLDDEPSSVDSTSELQLL